MLRKALRDNAVWVMPLLLLSCDGRAAEHGPRAARLDPSSGERLVTIETILGRCTRSVESVRWRTANELVAAFVDGRSRRSAIRVIGLDGSVGTAVSDGLHFSVSPDGRLLLEQTEDGWLVRDFRGAVRFRLEEPAEAGHRFSYCCSSAWSADGRFAALVEHHSPSSGEAQPTIAADVPVVRAGVDFAKGTRTHSRVTIIDVSKGFSLRRFEVDDSALGIAWDSTNRLLVSTSGLRTGKPSTRVLRIEPVASRTETVYDSRGRFQSLVPSVRPGGDMVALVLDLDNRTWDDFNSILLIDAATGEETRRLTHDLPVKGEDYVWSSDGKEIFARVGHGGLDQIYAVPVDGPARRLTDEARRHFDLQLSPDGRRLSYQTMDGYGRHDVRVLNLKTGVEKVVLAIADPQKEFRLGEWQHVRWESTDGVRPFGYLITPPDFDAHRDYPMIVDVHGGGEGSRLYLQGPFTGSVNPGPLEWHAWAALGYVVFVPDYRSTGDYGPQVIAARYDTGELAALNDIEDIVSGTRFVTNLGFVDPERIAILGHSAGGQRVYVLLTKHDLYSAATLIEPIPPDPASLFMSLASGRNTGGYPAEVFEQMYGGRLNEVPDRYKVNYMFDSYRIATPALIMLGNEDLGGVDHMPNEVLYSILREQNVPARLLKFTEEGHTYAHPEAAKLAFREARRWLETHMPSSR